MERIVKNVRSDAELLADETVRKRLSVCVAHARNVFAADASGTSDPFATVVLEPFDPDAEDLKEMRRQVRGRAPRLARACARRARARPPRTKWTRRVPHPVLIGHATSLTSY
jgi:hypothetical protein